MSTTWVLLEHFYVYFGGKVWWMHGSFHNCLVLIIVCRMVSHDYILHTYTDKTPDCGNIDGKGLLYLISCEHTTVLP